MSGPGPYGPGRRSEPHEVPGGRRDVPFGPDVSWPNGFRQLDSEARRLLESGYGTQGYGRGQYDHVDPATAPAARPATGSRPWMTTAIRAIPIPPTTGREVRPAVAAGRAIARGPAGSARRRFRLPRGVPGYRVPDYREPTLPAISRAMRRLTSIR